MSLPQAIFALSWLLATLATCHRIPGHQFSPFPPQKHLPPDDASIFQRADVESETQDDQVEYGSWSLPLRSAVESLPEGYYDQAHRAPLRDAVENSLGR